jgi:hypothetical protein
LTGEFLELEREIDSFASQGGLSPRGGTMEMILQGKQAGLDEQLASIETKADALREKAVERFSGSVAAPGHVAPAAPEPRRSWLRRMAGWWFGVRAAG